MAARKGPRAEGVLYPPRAPTVEEARGVVVAAIDDSIAELEHGIRYLQLRRREIAAAPGPGAMVRLAEDAP